MQYARAILESSLFLMILWVANGKKAIFPFPYTETFNEIQISDFFWELCEDCQWLLST